HGPAEIIARQLAPAGAAVARHRLRGGARPRGTRRATGAGAVLDELLHGPLGLLLRGGNHGERVVARAAPRRARAAVARLPDGQPRHSVPVPADLPARR